MRKHNSEKHSYILLDEAEKDMQNRIQNLLNNAKDKMSRNHENISCVQVELVKLKSKYENAKSVLESSFKSIIKLGDKHHGDIPTNAAHQNDSSEAESASHGPTGTKALPGKVAVSKLDESTNHIP